MTALAADRRLTNSATDASRQRVGKAAGSVIIYKGAAICANSSGYLVPGANTAGLKFVGWAECQVDTTGIADGVSDVLYRTGCSIKMKNDATYPVAQANLGGPVWLQDDQTVRNIPGNVLVGVAEQIESDGEVLVFGDPDGGFSGSVYEPITLTYDHAQAAADATTKLYKVPAGKQFRLTGVDYINPTGLVQDAANAFIVKVTKDGTVMASWSTITGAQGTIAANTFVALVNSVTDADLVAAAGAIIALFLDEQGDTTLPAGRVVIRGQLLPA
jgi:hypothetical protein